MSLFSAEVQKAPSHRAEKNLLATVAAIAVATVLVVWFSMRIATVEILEHEATTSKVSDDQMFLCRQRGIDEEKAVSMIVNGFCKEVFKELPMEFAVEAGKLLEVSLEGAVG